MRRLLDSLLGTLALASMVGLSACSKPTGVIVTVDGLHPDIQTLYVAVKGADGKAGMLSSQRIDPAKLNQNRFALELPANAADSLTIEVLGLTEKGFTKAEGSQTAAVLPASVTEATVTLKQKNQDCLADGWRFEGPILRPHSINALWAFTDNGKPDVWAMGDRGVFYRWDGSVWRDYYDEIASKVKKEQITGIWAFENKEIWLASWNGGNNNHGRIYNGQRGNDGKISISVNSDEKAVYRLWATDREHFWGNGTYLYAFNSSGFDKTTMLSYSRGLSINKSGDVYVAKDGGEIDIIPISTRTNNLYKKIYADAYSIWTSTDSQSIWATGYSGIYNCSSPATQACALISDISNVPNTMFFDISGFDGNDIWAVGQRGTIVHYDGGSWKKIATAKSYPDLRTIYVVGHQEAWLSGESGTVLHCKINGTDCEVTGELGGLPNFNDVWGTDVNGSPDVWVVGNGSTIYHFKEGGWKRVPLVVSGNPYSIDITGIWGADPNNVWIVGTSIDPGKASILHWDGITWQVIVSPESVQAELRPSIWGQDADNILVGWGQGQVRRKSMNWAKESTKLTGAVNSIYGTATNNIFVLTHEKKISRFNGITWTEDSSFNSINQGSVDIVNQSSIFAANGHVWASINRGPEASTIYHSAGAGWDMGKDPDSGTKSGIGAIGGISEKNLWAGGRHLHLVGSTDGSVWTPADRGFQSAKIINRAETPSSTIRRIFGFTDRAGNQHIYAVGDGGMIMHRAENDIAPCP